MSVQDKKFVFAHELGHIVLHHTSYNDVLGSSNNPITYNIQEKEADLFAISFLAPAPILLRLNVKNTSELCRITGLSRDICIKILEEVKNEKAMKFSISSYKIADNFEYYIFNYKFKKYRYYIKHISLLMCILFLLSYVFSLKFINREQSISIKNSISKHNTNTNANINILDTVYITKSGSKYHIENCTYLKSSSIPLTLDNAINNGYDACKICID